MVPSTGQGPVILKPTPHFSLQNLSLFSLLFSVSLNLATYLTHIQQV